MLVPMMTRQPASIGCFAFSQPAMPSGITYTFA
jgi:hypothetical protein